jgi:hypothetical protein
MVKTGVLLAGVLGYVWLWWLLLGIAAGGNKKVQGLLWY